MLIWIKVDEDSVEQNNKQRGGVNRSCHNDEEHSTFINDLQCFLHSIVVFIKVICAIVLH